jgi:hypothetical protein
MLKFAILQKVESNGQVLYKPILESEDGDFIRELTSRVKRILGPKESFTSREIHTAIEEAYNEYKKEFKERTVKLS